MKAKLHSMIAGGPFKIAAKTDTKFSSHGNYIQGKNLYLMKNRQIVQTWRAEVWDKKDLDSIFMISLE